MAIEETGQFRGTYHVLGGVISPIEGIGPNDLNIDTLLARIERDSIEELIMAISPTIDGETTIYYLSKKLVTQISKLAKLHVVWPLVGSCNTLTKSLWVDLL